MYGPHTDTENIVKMKKKKKGMTVVGNREEVHTTF